MKDLKNFRKKLVGLLPQFKRYLAPLFCLLLFAVYGFIVYRIQTLNSAEPSAAQTSVQNPTAQVPRIDPKVLAQLQQLQDNSVSVKTLFDQARSNPFQE